MKYATAFFYCLLVVLCGPAIAQSNTIPVITNFSASLNEAEKVILLDYNLFDKEESHVDVELKVIDESKNEMYSPEPGTLNGDVGKSVSIGVKRQIEWHYPKQLNVSAISFRLIADDNYKVKVQELINLVDIAEMKKTVAAVHGERNGTVNGQKNLAKVRKYIENAFDERKVKNEAQRIAIDRVGYYKKMKWDIPAGLKNRTFDVQNIVATIDGTQAIDQTIILCAHYDSAPGSPGADDNASGVAGMLEAARILSKYKFKINIKFIAFDCEEDGMVGSRLYLSEGLKDNKNTSRVVNFDMIGYYSEKPNTQTIPDGFAQIFPNVIADLAKDSNKGNFVISTSDDRSKEFGEQFVSNAHKYVPKLKIVSLLAVVDGTMIEALASSDHAAFWEKGYQALHIGDGAETRNSFMHTKDDTTSLINYEFASNIVKATIANVAEFASVQHCGVGACKLGVVGK